MGEHQVGKTHQHAVQAALGQGGPVHAGQQVGAAQRIHLGGRQGCDGQPEFHLGQALAW